MGTKKSKKKTKKLKGKAAGADKYALYLKAVQAPDVDVQFFLKTFEALRGRPAHTLREDFCGTAAVCCEWVKTDAKRLAYGVDLDPEPLAWGKKNTLSKLEDEERERITLIEGDVRDGHVPPVDLIAAQNFSFNVFKTRDALRAYFEAAREHLGKDGVFVLDVMGGSQAFVEEFEEEREIGKNVYIWEQERFDPITHDCVMHIHFRFKDGSKLERAFTYEWRLWTLPELREVLAEAGFASSTVYWEGTDDETGEGNGEYSPTESAESDPSWIAYLVASK